MGSKNPLISSVFTSTSAAARNQWKGEIKNVTSDMVKHELRVASLKAQVDSLKAQNKI